MATKITIREVAQAAEVSITSVSLYLNDKPGLSDDTRKRIARAITSLGYVPLRQKSGRDGAAKGGKASDAALIGLLVERLPFSMLSDLHYGEVIQSMEAHARDLGYHLSLVVVENSGLPAQLSERFDNLDGVIILGGGDITENVVNQAVEEEVPAILVDVNLPSAPIDSVLIDNFNGAFSATRLLIERGYQRIGCIQGPFKYPSLVERFQGYCAALIRAGIPLDPALIQPSISSGFPNKGYREMRALLDRPSMPDAVFCVSDRTALGALEALHQAGLRIPEDVALVGFENIPHSEYTNPPLTTINMPKRLMGEVAIRRLHDIIQGRMYEAPVKTILNTSLVIRSSA